jgi:hypothetical protein
LTSGHPIITAPASRFAAVWGLFGVAATFVEAIYRLGARALEAIEQGLSPVQWATLALSTVTLVYFEGYRALQRRFAPRVVQRALAVGAEPLRWKLLAPLYVLSLVGAPRKEFARGWLAVGLIVGAVFAVRAMAEPWRGIVDGAVACALSWGLVALLAESFRGLRAN